MNILAINNSKFTPLKSNDKSQNITVPRFGLTLSQPLSKDTVSFGAKMVIADAVVRSAEQDMARLKRLGTTFLDVLESIAMKLEPLGVSFNRGYCEANVVKDPKKYISKMKRAGSVSDKLRATLFIKNPYNLSILNDNLLPELQKRGLVIAKTDGNLDELIAKGYVPNIKELSGKPVSVPDLDIRLADAVSSVNNLNPEYKYCIGKPQKSGYEDIQMRLVREYDTKKIPVLHELIILMGENYAKAKHLESDLVYGIIRNLDELSVVQRGNKNIESYQATKRAIDVIKSIFTEEISQKLFRNAKKLDLTGEKNLEKIKISAETMENIEKYFNQLEKSVSSCYKTAKASKRIADSTKKKLEIEYKNDRAKIAEIRNRLKETIDFFNKQDYLKNKTKIS